MLTVYVPPGVGFHCFEMNGIVNDVGQTTTLYARQHEGSTVIDLPRFAFVALLQGRDGLHWERANPAAMEWIGRNKGEPMYPVFPHLAAAPIPPSAPAEPVMVRMIAPENCGGASVEGKAVIIGDDRSVVVTAAVAEQLLGHGFVRAA